MSLLKISTHNLNRQKFYFLIGLSLTFQVEKLSGDGNMLLLNLVDEFSKSDPKNFDDSALFGCIKKLGNLDFKGWSDGPVDGQIKKFNEKKIIVLRCFLKRKLQEGGNFVCVLKIYVMIIDGASQGSSGNFFASKITRD